MLESFSFYCFIGGINVSRNVLNFHKVQGQLNIEMMRDLKHIDFYGRSHYYYTYIKLCMYFFSFRIGQHIFCDFIHTGDVIKDVQFRISRLFCFLI